jgi:hypothetical protein
MGFMKIRIKCVQNVNHYVKLVKLIAFIALVVILNKIEFWIFKIIFVIVRQVIQKSTNNVN